MKKVKPREDPVAQKILQAHSVVSGLAIGKRYQEIAFQTVLNHLLQTSKMSGGWIEPQETKLKRKVAKEALTDRIGELAGEGFFKEPKGASEVLDELKNRGYHHPFASVGMALLSLVRRRELRRVPVGRAGKKQFLYTNP
jgi:hypothetical protein